MLGFVNKLFISVQLIFFLDHVLLLADLVQKFKFFKIAVWWSDSKKRNFGRFIFKMIIENIVPVLKGLNSRLLSHFPPKLTTVLLGTRVEFLFVAADMRIAWTLGPPYLIVYWWCWCSNNTKFNTKGTTINYRVCK